MVENKERTLFERIVLGVCDRFDPDHAIVATNKKGKSVVITRSDLKTDFILKYKLQPLDESSINP